MVRSRHISAPERGGGRQECRAASRPDSRGTFTRQERPEPTSRPVREHAHHSMRSRVEYRIEAARTTCLAPPCHGGRRGLSVLEASLGLSSLVKTSWIGRGWLRRILSGWKALTHGAAAAEGVTMLSPTRRGTPEQGLVFFLPATVPHGDLPSRFPSFAPSFCSFRSAWRLAFFRRDRTMGATYLAIAASRSL